MADPRATIVVSAEDRFSRTFANLKRDIAAGQGQLAGLTSAAGLASRALGLITFGAIGAGGFAAGVLQLAKDLDALNDVSDATGDTVENLSALEDVARRNGGSLDLVSASLTKLNKVLQEATPGSALDDSLSRLGLNAAELRKAVPTDALQQFAVALAGITNDGDKARLVQVFLGKSLGELAPFLKDVAESGKLNAKVTTDQAAAAERFNKELAALSTNVGNAARSLVSELIPALNQLFDDQRTGGFAKIFSLDKFGSKIDQISLLLQGVGQAKRALELKDAISLNPDNVVQLREQLAQVEAEGRRIGEVFKKVRGEFDAFDKQLNPRDQRLLAGLEGPGKPKIGNTSGLGDKSGITSAKLSAVEQYIQRLESANLAALDLSATESLTIDIALGKLPGLTEASRSYLQALAEGLDALKVKSVALNTPLEAFRSSEIAATEAVNAALNTERLEKYNAERDRLNRLLEATPSAALQQQQQDLLALGSALERGAISINQYYEAVETRLGKLPPTLDESTRRAEDFGNAMAGAATRALTGFGDVGDIFDTLGRQLADLAIQTALFNPLKGMLTSGGAGLFSLLGFANGGAFDSRGPARFAAGGVFDSPTLFKFASGGAMNNGVLGEAGPEAILPLKRGPGGKLGVVAQGGGVTVNNYLTVGSGVSRNEFAAALEQNKRATIAAVADARRRGRETV
jgi:predicted  nucleic acid-binding Zn-ribbon protein